MCISNRRIVGQPRAFDSAVTDLAATSRLTGERQCAAETAEGLNVARVIGVQPTRFERGCQQVGGLRIGLPTTPIRVLVADGRLQPDERILRRADAFVDGSHTGEIASPHVVRRRTETHPCPVGQAQLGQRRRALEPFRRILVGQALLGHQCRLTRVAQCLFVVPQHVRVQVVVGQTRNDGGVPAGVERLGGARMHDPQPGRRHAADDGLAGEGVDEREFAIGVVDRADQPDGFRRIDRCERRGGIRLAGRDERGQIESLPQHRRLLDDFPDALSQPTEAAGDGIPDRGGNGSLGTQSGYPAPAFEIVDEFREEERVAAGLVPQEGRRRPRGCRGQLLSSANELGDRLGVQPREIEAADALEPVQFGQPGDELVGAVGFGGAEGGHHEHAGVGAADQHVFEHRQRG